MPTVSTKFPSRLATSGRHLVVEPSAAIDGGAFLATGAGGTPAPEPRGPVWRAKPGDRLVVADPTGGRTYTRGDIVEVLSVVSPYDEREALIYCRGKAEGMYAYRFAWADEAAPTPAMWAGADAFEEAA